MHRRSVSREPRFHVGFLAIGGALAACGSPPDPPPAHLALGPSQPVYVGTATVDPASGALHADWVVRLVTDSSMAEGVTLLLAEKLDLATIEGHRVAGYTESLPEEEGDDRKLIDVTWTSPASPGEVREIRIAYDGVLYDSVRSNALNRISPEWIELGLDAAWHPVVASFDHDLVGELTLRLPDQWIVVASGEVTRHEGAHIVRSPVPQPDFAFVAAPDLRRSGPEDIAVYHRSADSTTVREVVEAATACRDWLSRRFGALPPLRFVLAPRTDGGYARKNFIVLTSVDDYPAPVLSRFVCHELSHYWSSAASPTSADYWMTESFAEIVAARHVRDTYGDTAYAPILEQWISQSVDRPPVWTDTSTERGSVWINYRKGPLRLSELEERIGPDRFAEFLRRYMTDRPSTTSQLLDQLEQVSGEAASRWFREKLAEGS